MRAAQLVEPGRITCVDAPVPSLGEAPGVLVRTLRAAICGSDLHVVFGGINVDGYPCPYGFPGHEAVAEVMGSTAPGFRAGDRVLAVPEARIAGSFAEYQVVAPDSLLPLPPSLGLDAVLAQQLGTVVYALKRFWPGGGGECATVLGAGPAGLCFLQLLRHTGFERIVVADLEPHRLALAERLGADVVVDARTYSAADVTFDETRGIGADLVVEAAGHDAARTEAVRSVRQGGRVGFFGLPERHGEVPFPYELAFRRRPTIELLWGAQSEPELDSFRTALRLLVDGAVDVSGYVTHQYPIERIDDAFAHAARRDDGALKIAVDFPG
jgi:L-iditol 2-dehydrogenase